MNEEKVTKCLLKWLIDNGWEIVCYDFPQSGTGRLLHPNKGRSKNADAVNPDIVAVKNTICVYMENKDRYYYPDFQKVNMVIKTGDYTDAIRELLKSYSVEKIYCGIGMPVEAYTSKVMQAVGLVDFVLGLEENGKVKMMYKSKQAEVFEESF